MKKMQDRTPEENRQVGKLLTNMPAIKRQLATPHQSGGIPYDSGKEMSREREFKVAQVIKSL